MIWYGTVPLGTAKLETRVTTACMYRLVIVVPHGASLTHLSTRMIETLTDSGAGALESYRKRCTPYDREVRSRLYAKNDSRMDITKVDIPLVLEDGSMLSSHLQLQEHRPLSDHV